MENNIKNIFVTSLVLSIFIFIFMVSSLSYYSDSSLALLDLNKNSWIPVLDFSSNSYYMWKFYNLFFNCSLFLTDLLNLDFNLTLYLFNLCVFLISIIFLSKNINKNLSVIAIIFFSINFILLITLLYGNKTFLISSISLLPLYILALKNLYEKKSNILFNILFFILISILLAKTSNHFSFLYIIFSGILVSCISEMPFFKTNFIFYIFSIIYSLKHIIISIPLLPKIFFPWYAKVVPDDGLAGNIMPLLNEGTEIPFLNENLEMNLYSPFIFIFSIYILFIIIKYFKSKDVSLKKLSFLISFFILSFIIDLYFPKNISSIFFIKTLQRIIPSIFLFSPYPIFLFLMLFSFFIFILKRPQNFIFIFLLNIFLSFFIVTAHRYSPIFITDSTISYIEKLQKNKESLTSNSILLSPSTAVIKEYGLQYYEKKDMLFNKKHFKNILTLSPTLDSNYNKDSLKNILRKSPKARWGSKKSRQDGDEWIKIILPNEMTLTGVFISTGNFKTDFPDELEFVDCNSNKLIMRQKNLGNVEFTPNGYPYYGAQDKVTFLFPNNITTNCLLIKQVGKNKNYDWSISTIKFILKSSNI